MVIITTTRICGNSMKQKKIKRSYLSIDLCIKYYIDCYWIFLYYLFQRNQDLYVIKLQIILSCLYSPYWFFFLFCEISTGPYYIFNCLIHMFEENSFVHINGYFCVELSVETIVYINGGALSVNVIVIENGIRNLNSNPE